MWEPDVSHVHTMRKVDRTIIWLCEKAPSLHLVSSQEFLAAIKRPHPPGVVAPAAAPGDSDLAQPPPSPEATSLGERAQAPAMPSDDLWSSIQDDPWSTQAWDWFF
jgi:hypothetical protein